MIEVELEKVGINKKERILSISSLNPVVAFVGEKIIDVCKKLSSSGHRSLPVVDRKMRLLGIITITDIFSFFISGGNMNDFVENIMSREVVGCDANESIGYVLQKMKISKRGRLPVTQEGKIVGVISETDFILAAKSFEAFENIVIDEVMTKKPFFVTPSFTLREVIRTMVNGKYRRLPVVENRALVGYVTSTLIFNYLVNNLFSGKILDRTISEIMTKNMITVLKRESLSNVLKKMKEKKISSMLIVDEDNKLEGIFTERDYINLLV
ncbi:MAG: CBS domain-containing protein [Candidatus Aenigmarchaeota archaeon]|nr:CBS domain-containing protein [Candidatus Aenigmarchaeota archaeon]